MTWVFFVDFKPRISTKPRIKNQAQVEALITHSSRTLYLIESCLMVDCQILILILWPSTCSNDYKYWPPVQVHLGLGAAGRRGREGELGSHDRHLTPMLLTCRLANAASVAVPHL